MRRAILWAVAVVMLTCVVGFGASVLADEAGLLDLARKPDSASQQSFSEMARTDASSLSDDAKGRVLDQLRSGLLNNESALAAAEPSAIRQALLGASHLGMPFAEQVQSLVRATTATARLSEASASDLSFYFTFLGEPAAGAGVDRRSLAEARGRLIGVVRDRIGSWADRVPSDREIAETARLVRSAAPMADQDQRGELAAALVTAYGRMADGAQVLSGPGSTHIHQMLISLGRPDATAALTAGLILDHEGWTDRSPHQLADLYAALTPPSSPRADEARRRLLEHLAADLERFAAVGYRLNEDHAGAVDRDLVERFAQVWQAQGPRAEAMSVETLGHALTILRHAEADTASIPESWWVVARQRIDRGSRFEGGFAEYQRVGRMIRSDAAIERLEAVLQAPSGLVRQDMAKLLAWAYSESERLDGWKAQLAERGGEESRSSDERATWLLARAYAAHVLPADAERMPGESWAQQALAIAEAEPVRLAALEWLVYERERFHDYPNARALVQSIAHQFVDPALSQRIAALDTRLQQAAYQDLSRQETYQLAAKLRRDQGMLRSLEHRLERYQAEGRSQEDIASIEAMIAQLLTEFQPDPNRQRPTP